MRDYTVIQKKAKHCAEQEYCGNCKYIDSVPGVTCLGDKSNVMDDAADAFEELLAFARFVAREAIDTGDNDGVSAEILCRKLNKLGLIETDGEFWMLPTPPKGVE